MTSHEIILDHERLIRYYVTAFTKSHRELREDIYQESMVVILRKAKNFDPSKGLSKQSRWWCLAALNRVFRDAGIRRGGWKAGSKPEVVTMGPPAFARILDAMEGNVSFASRV